MHALCKNYLQEEYCCRFEWTKIRGKCDRQKGQKCDVTDSSDDEQPPVKVTRVEK